MIFADEIVDPGSLEELQAAREAEATKRELDVAKQLIGSLQADFDPSSYRDDYRERVLDLVERKAQGEQIEVVAEPEPEAEPGPRPDERPEGEPRRGSLRAAGGGLERRNQEGSRQEDRGEAQGRDQAQGHTRQGDRSQEARGQEARREVVGRQAGLAPFLERRRPHDAHQARGLLVTGPDAQAPWSGVLVRR